MPFSIRSPMNEEQQDTKPQAITRHNLSELWNRLRGAKRTTHNPNREKTEVMECEEQDSSGDLGKA